MTENPLGGRFRDTKQDFNFLNGGAGHVLFCQKCPLRWMGRVVDDRYVRLVAQCSAYKEAIDVEVRSA
jgi:hypothetical protein